MWISLFIHFNRIRCCSHSFFFSPSISWQCEASVERCITLYAGRDVCALASHLHTLCVCHMNVDYTNILQSKKEICFRFVLNFEPINQTKSELFFLSGKKIKFQNQQQRESIISKAAEAEKKTTNHDSYSPNQVNCEEKCPRHDQIVGTNGPSSTKHN